MLPQFGFAEFFVVAAVALIVVGPRELPLLMRRMGKMARKARDMARDFQKSFDEIGRETELDELRREISDLKRLNPVNELRRPFEDAGREMSGRGEKKGGAGGSTLPKKS